MKITDPRIIEKSEQHLMAAIQKNLDPDTVRQILSDHLAGISFLSKGGRIVVHDQQIAFRLDFDLQLNGSLLFDRQGNYLSGTSDAARASDETAGDEPHFMDGNEDISGTASPDGPGPDPAFPAAADDTDSPAGSPDARVDHEIHAILTESLELRKQRNGV